MIGRLFHFTLWAVQRAAARRWRTHKNFYVAIHFLLLFPLTCSHPWRWIDKFTSSFPKNKQKNMRFRLFPFSCHPTTAKIVYTRRFHLGVGVYMENFYLENKKQKSNKTRDERSGWKTTKNKILCGREKCSEKKPAIGDILISLLENWEWNEFSAFNILRSNYSFAYRIP